MQLKIPIIYRYHNIIIYDGVGVSYYSIYYRGNQIIIIKISTVDWKRINNLYALGQITIVCTRRTERPFVLFILYFRCTDYRYRFTNSMVKPFLHG